MNTVNMPGFTAEASLYKSSGRYRIALFDDINNNSVVLQVRPPSGLCQKASRLCQNPERGGQWCDILERCFDEPGGSGGGSGGSGGTNGGASGGPCGPGNVLSPGGTVCCPSAFPFGMNCFGQRFCSFVNLSGVLGCTLL